MKINYSLLGIYMILNTSLNSKDQSILSRVYNKEEKRVLNALYAPCKMFLESHMPRIQTLTNESAQFKYIIMGVASSAHQRKHDSDWKHQQIAIQNERSWRIYHKTYEKCLYSSQSGEKSSI